MLTLGAVLMTGCSGSGDDNVTLPIPQADAGTVQGCTGRSEFLASRGAAHIAEPDPITYQDTPPSSGNHRPQWGRWGEYSSIPPERWLHNLEHGGAAFLYRPGDTATADAMRAYAKARPADAGGAFRYILAPYDGLPKPFTVVVWEWTYAADELCDADLGMFLSEHYRRAPEDIASDGAFTDNWIAR